MFKLLFLLNLSFFASVLSAQPPSIPLTQEIRTVSLGGKIPSSTPIILAMNGAQASLESRFLEKKPNIIIALEYACSNECGALLKLFRKVLTESSVKIGEELNVVTIGIGKNDTWDLGRQRGLKIYERFYPREKIEERWSFAVGSAGFNQVLEHLGGGLLFGDALFVPRVAILTPDNRVSSIFTTKNLSTESFKKAVSDAQLGIINTWSTIESPCIGSGGAMGPNAERGLLAMRVGLVASLFLFFGCVYFLVRVKRS